MTSWVTISSQQYAFTNCKLQHLFVLLQDPNQHWPYLEAALYSWSAVAESLAEEEECPILTQFLAKLPVIPYNNNMRVKKVLGYISDFHPLQFKIKLFCCMVKKCLIFQWYGNLNHFCSKLVWTSRCMQFTFGDKGEATYLIRECPTCNWKRGEYEHRP